MNTVKQSNRKTTYPEGPFTTGCCDVMVGKDRLGVLMRIFYPTSLSHIDAHHDKWTKWHLGSMYSHGLGKFFMPWTYPGYQLVSDILTRESRIPSVWEAPVADGLFPLVIFSHGLAAHRGLYSSVCNNIASHGLIVAAVEHRDGSACASFVLKENGKKEWSVIKNITSPKFEFDIRYEQVGIRAAEVMRAMDVLESLNSGKIERNELPSSLDLHCFRGRVDTSNAVLAGHSFGGATTILALSKDHRFKAGLCLDPWLFPLHAFHRSRISYPEAEVLEMDHLSEKVTQPMLFILMEGFQDKKNLDALKKYDKERNKTWTVLKGVHQNQTDSAILFKGDWDILKRIIGCASKIDPDTAMKLNNRILINFLCTTLNYQTQKCEEYQHYVFRNSRWAYEGAEGSAKYMAGWHHKIVKK